MNYTQNYKIAQVAESTMVVGVDIGSEMNYARVFNWRGQELSRKVFHFSNDLDGFSSFLDYMEKHRAEVGLQQIIVGCEPTGHYWFNLARYLKMQDINLVVVNPYHVKQIKELDDNSPRKTDLNELWVTMMVKVITETMVREGTMQKGYTAVPVKVATTIAVHTVAPAKGAMIVRVTSAVPAKGDMTEKAIISQKAGAVIHLMTMMVEVNNRHSTQLCRKSPH